MPTYEYRCENGHMFEQFQKMSDPAVEVCPQCGAKAERLMSAGAGLVFKGSGFYITDYRGDDYKKAAESDKTGSAGSAAGAPTTSSESKPESKPAGGDKSATPPAASGGSSSNTSSNSSSGSSSSSSSSGAAKPANPKPKPSSGTP